MHLPVGPRVTARGVGAVDEGWGVGRGVGARVDSIGVGYGVPPHTLLLLMPSLESSRTFSTISLLP